MQIHARRHWNDTGMDVVAGQKLVFTVSGEWFDAGHRSDRTGLVFEHLQAFESWRRAPEARWVELVGCIGRDLGQTFRLDAEGRAVAPAAGRLYLFANDVWFMYFNNSGALDVSIS